MDTHWARTFSCPLLWQHFSGSQHWRLQWPAPYTWGHHQACAPWLMSVPRGRKCLSTVWSLTSFAAPVYMHRHIVPALLGHGGGEVSGMGGCHCHDSFRTCSQQVGRLEPLVQQEAGEAIDRWAGGSSICHHYKVAALDHFKARPALSVVEFSTDIGLTL